jgi:hypothetical protein
VLAAGFASGVAGASSIILDGDFLDPIGTGNTLTPWSDWTNAGVTRHPAPSGIQGNYASLPVGADLFQRFSALPNGGYVISFLVENPSPDSAELVLAIQQAGGTFISDLFAAGTTEHSRRILFFEFLRCADSADWQFDKPGRYAHRCRGCEDFLFLLFLSPRRGP